MILRKILRLQKSTGVLLGSTGAGTEGTEVPQRRTGVVT